VSARRQRLRSQPAAAWPRAIRSPVPASDVERIEALYREFAHSLIVHVAGVLRRPRHAVEDACQFAWLTLTRRPDVLDGPSPRGWLITVALHAYLAEWRSAPVAVEGLDTLEAPPLEDAIEARDALSRVAKLRPVRRRVFERRPAGLSYTEIMAELGITYTNVNRQVTESRAELRRAA
jgi:RNA polymerase sigma factor (sigma-70 family)